MLIPKHLLFLSCFAFFLFACTGKKASVAEEKGADFDSIPNLHAANFRVERQGELTILSIGKAWRGAEQQFRYVLYPKGQPAPKGFDQAILIPVPVSRVICTGTTQVAMLDFLQVSDRIVGIADGKYLYNEKLRARIESGDLPELGDDNGLNYEKAL